MIQIVQYKQCYAVIGNTKPIKDSLKALSARYNDSLSINNSKVAGWLLFSEEQRVRVETFLLSITYTPYTGGNAYTGTGDSPQLSDASSSSEPSASSSTSSSSSNSPSFTHNYSDSLMISMNMSKLSLLSSDSSTAASTESALRDSFAQTNTSTSTSTSFVKKLLTICNGVMVVQYSASSFALLGDTIPIKDRCKQWGGSFNKSLSFDDKKQPGWIFPIDKLDQVLSQIKAVSSPISISQPSQAQIKLDDYNAVLHFDGGAAPTNPGPAGCGAVLIVDGVTRFTVGKYIEHATNNVAEYSGLILGLATIVENHTDIRKLLVKGDSRLIINQMKGSFKVHNDTLKELHKEASGLASSLDDIQYMWVAREENSEADAIADKCIENKADIPYQ